MVVLETTIEKIGNSVPEITQNNMIILFGGEAPEDLKDYCVVLQSHDLAQDISTDMVVCFGDQSFPITAVGEQVSYGLDSMGHCTIRFDSATIPDLPGCLHVERAELPAIQLHMPVRIFVSKKGG